MRTIYPTNDQNPIYVDDIDYNYLANYNWYHVLKESSDYFYTNTTNNYVISTMLMHHEIIKRKLNINEIPEGMNVVRLDNNAYNNTRNNLALATSSQACQNRKYSKGIVGYKGIHMDRDKYRAEIQIPNGKRKFLGNYDTAEQAAYQYNSAANMLFGKFAYLNELPIVTNVKTGQVVTGKIYDPNYKLYEPTKKFQSKYYGVSKNARNGYRARIVRNRQEIRLGNFHTEKDAAKAVDNYLISIGEQPRNFI